MEGWIKIYRKMLDNPIITKDGDYLSVWIYLLLNATHEIYDTIIEGQRITLQKGQLVTGRKSISQKLHINESKVQRILKCFENEQQIEQQTNPRNRVITITNWNEYQTNEQVIEQQMNNKRTTSEQQVNTNKKIKNIKNIKKSISKIFVSPSLEEIKQYILDNQLKVNANDFYNYFTAGNWIDSKGNKVKSWKQKLITWNSHEETKTKKQESKQYNDYDQREYKNISELYANKIIKEEKK